MRNSCAALLLASTLVPGLAAADESPPPAPRSPGFGLALQPLSPGQQCRRAIRAAERDAGIPTQLMAAIGRIESGRRSPSGEIDPWPWTIDVEGTDHIYDSKAEAVAAVRGFQAHGIRSIDVGCMQVSLLHHPDAFPSLDAAFEPDANARYAARFLTELHGQTGSWQKATAWYHSATPELGEPYAQRVMAVWPEEQRNGTALAWAGPRREAPPLAGPVGGGGNALSNRAETARILPLPNSGPAGRGLGAYRAAPIPLAARGLGLRHTPI